MAVALGQPGELPGALSIDQQGGVVDPAGSNATLGLGGNVTGVPVYNASLIVPNITAGGWVRGLVGLVTCSCMCIVVWVVPYVS